MTVTLTYDNSNAKVTINATGLAAANVATVERSVNQVVWTTVRGAGAWPVTAGAFTTPLDDYEFAPGLPNYYRVRGVETGPITFRAAGAVAADANAGGVSTVTPALPAGLVDGDMLVMWVTIRNKGVGSPAVPAGWTEQQRNNNCSLMTRTWVTGVTAPTVTFFGGAVNATLIAQIIAFRSASPTVVTSAADQNAIPSQQNVPYLGLTMPSDGLLAIVAAWKQNQWTSIAPIAGFTEATDFATALGSGASIGVDYQIQTARANVAAGSIVVTGGSSSISTAVIAAFPHAAFLNEQLANITPVLDRVWLKSLVRPFLNRPVIVVGYSDPGRPARSTEFDVTSRTLPVSINDLRGSRRWSVQLYVKTAADAQTLDFMLAAGDQMLLHVPYGSDVPGGYVTVKDTAQRHPDGRVRGKSRVFTLPLVESAPAGPDVAANISTWASVLAAYPSWDAVLAVFPTWADLLGLHGDPSEVIVP